MQKKLKEAADNGDRRAGGSEVTKYLSDDSDGLMQEEALVYVAVG